MKTKNKYLIPLALVSSSAFIYSVVNHQFSPKTEIKSSPNISTTQDSTDQLHQDTIFQKLSIIINRCRGCGKCVRIDPQHFEMSGRQAVVISSTNLTSSNLTLAINNCPSQAIALE
jgi:ferredoxin